MQKMKPTNNSITSLLRKFRFSGDELVLYYGSKGTGRDIDLFIVTSSRGPYEEIQIGRFDIVCVSPEYAYLLADSLDILITEPFMKGAIINSNDYYNDVINRINTPGCCSKVLSHYLLQAMRCRLSAETYITRLEQDGFNLKTAESAAFSIAWTCSYKIGYDIFKNERRTNPITYDELISSQHGVLLSKSRDLARELRKYTPSSSLESIFSLKNVLDLELFK